MPPTPTKPTHVHIKRYGWRPSPPDQRDQYLHFAKADFAKLAQIQSADLSDKMPPCYDQLNLGSCTANAVAGLLQYNRITQNKDNQATPSRLYIYWNERYLDPYASVNEDTGSTISMGMKAVKTYGFADEALWPYDTSKYTIEAPSSVYVSAVQGRISNYARVPQTLPNLQTALVQGHPIAFGFTVYQSFESRMVAETGIVPMPQRSEYAVGGHAVVCVGFDNATQRFKVRNSWGSDWGKNGYFTIPYAYLTNPNLAGDFWVINAIP